MIWRIRSRATRFDSIPRSSLHIAKHLLLWIVLPLVALGLLVACAPTATLNALASTGSHTLSDGVAYGPLPRPKLDIYRPAAAAPPGGR
jgi:hypothetical protein